MKQCGTCKEFKSLDYFSKNKTKSDGLQSFCIACKQIYSKSHYKENKDLYAKRARIRDAKTRIENYTYLMEYVKTNPCVDCNENDYIVLEFDHIKGKKHLNISEMVKRSYSLNKIKEEIQKCEVRCANCHRRKTAERGNWYSCLDNVIDMEKIV